MPRKILQFATHSRTPHKDDGQPTSARIRRTPTPAPPPANTPVPLQENETTPAGSAVPRSPTAATTTSASKSSPSSPRNAAFPDHAADVTSVPLSSSSVPSLALLQSPVHLGDEGKMGSDQWEKQRRKVEAAWMGDGWTDGPASVPIIDGGQRRVLSHPPMQHLDAEDTGSGVLAARTLATQMDMLKLQAHEKAEAEDDGGVVPTVVVVQSDK